MSAPVLILAGGTGGHIFPGLAVARALRARNVPVVWLGATGGMETRLVPGNDVALRTLDVRGLRGKNWWSAVTAPLMLLRALFQALQIIIELRPCAVVSFGGYVAGPGGLAGWLMRRPMIVHEQNRSPGFTNRLLVPLSRRVLCGFPNSFSGGRGETVGNPVRPEIAALAPPESRFEARTGPIRLLVLGGSQGARALNEAVPKALASLGGSALFTVRHQCGEKMREQAERAYGDARVMASIEPFITDMASAYGWADLVIGRAGALTIAELCAAGVGSVLVPFPGAVDDHQASNAAYLAERGAGDWLRQDDRLDIGLRERLQALTGDRTTLLKLAIAARAASFPNAAEHVADIVMQESSK